MTYCPDCPRRAHRRWRPPRRRRAVPLRFRHSTTFSGWFAAHWATNSSGKKRTETEARLGVPGLDKLGGAPPSSPLGLRSDTPEGATGVAKLFGQISKYWYGPNPPRLLFTITRAIECEATKIRHTCGNCATICWSRQLAGLTLAVRTRAASLQVLASTLQHHCVKLIQQLVEFDKHLATVECRCAVASRCSSSVSHLRRVSTNALEGAATDSSSAPLTPVDQDLYRPLAPDCRKRTQSQAAPIPRALSLRAPHGSKRKRSDARIGACHNRKSLATFLPKLYKPEPKPNSSTLISSVPSTFA